MTSTSISTSMEEKPSSNDAQVFAFIIGINKYLATGDFATLQGAVNDAREFRQYLLDTREKRGLEVPPSNIVVLENEQATRANIIATFRSHFLDNPHISDNGNTTMIFYYAGHGTRIEAPENLIAFDGKVEAISPVDERTQDADGKYVYAIPDYVLGWLLWELAAKKGRNITVIFDACHSGGMGRNAGTARNADTPSLEVPLELDNELWGGKTDMAKSYQMWSQSTTSHVLLAACREDETAREIRYTDTDNSVHGRFTESLITWLRRVKLETTTYTDLLNRLPLWSGQTPHCGGARRDRRLFDENYPATGRRAVPIMVHTAPTPEDPNIVQTFRIDMGSVEGVVPGTEFSAHRANNTFLRILVAESVEIHRSILVTKDRQPLKLPAQSKAVVSDWKNDAMIIHVYTPPDFPYTADLFPTDAITPQPKGRKYVQAPTRERADIALRVTEAGDEIVIERLTSVILECQRETRVALKGNTARLPAVIDGIAHFNYFLERHHGSAPLEGVSLKMHRLLGNFPGRKPDPDAGPAGDGNLIKNHEARFPSRVGAKYGFTLCNESEEDLFPYLFYFDPVTYTIAMWYAPAGAHVQAPLQSHGTVTIGMGGERAFEFSLPPGEMESDSGFLKLFVATEHLTLDWIQQTISPFDERYEGTGRLDRKGEPMVHVPTWDALTVVLTMTSGK
ncbi:caspase domain-containing protein [Mycena galericulata]|nr:caspase domain-containing protein [Mycena galericulata]